MLDSLASASHDRETATEQLEREKHLMTTLIGSRRLRITSSKVKITKVEREAYRTYAEFRHVHFGFKLRTGIVHVLSQPSDISKLDKNAIPTWGLSLAPHTMARDYCRENGIEIGYTVPNQCPHATEECTANCLQANGNGRYKSTTLGRVCKTVFEHVHPDLFKLIVLYEVRSNLAKTLGDMRLRMNVISDRRWELIMPELFELRDAYHRLLSVYDYTKFPWLIRSAKVPANYHLTYSATEHTTTEQVRSMVDAGLSVAVVIRAKASQLSIPTYHGMAATNGDLHDDRTGDTAGVVLLSAKGTMRRSPMAKELVTA